jgi:alkylated DNA repair dioxygenase AlkB
MDLKVISEEKYQNSVFCYMPNVISQEYQVELLKWLDGIKDLQDVQARSGSKRSRLQKWIQADQSYFCKSWNTRYERWTSFKYDNTLIEMQNMVQKKVTDFEKYNIKTPKINSCLINKYRDGNDFIKAHQDTKLSFGKEPTIIGISLGSSRKICFKRVIYNPTSNYTPKLDRENQDKNFEYTLESGSMFIMAGSSQRYYTHEIPKCDVSGVRYSLTFREFLNDLK